ncbi:PREDICTED: collagen alpha-1(XXVIII) chain [Chaetura pelagica]|uniref:collagen alpha-1(XXVIII) chain n=1 Tax=Chaetura pelagica TaxID=8897 RepID=UPI000523D115|nr:PREDICTED: collagen alpha-1(XXVIII) chain [Chaetura pelagica]
MTHLPSQCHCPEPMSVHELQVRMVTIRGKGERGNQGLPGVKGSIGIGLPGPKVNPIFMGDYGDKGDPGSKGAKGEVGDSGHPGPKGIWGGKREPGLSLSCGIKCTVTPVEVVFVIDSSESVRPDNFNIIKTFMKTVIHKLGESTYTASAIQEATQLFQAAHPAVRKVAVVITAGQADSCDKLQLDTAGRKVHAMNIEMFVIGIVQRTDPHYDAFLKEMQLMATDPDEEHVYQIDDFITLSGERNYFSKRKLEISM